jgi:hypothetical protein
MRNAFERGARRRGFAAAIAPQAGKRSCATGVMAFVARLQRIFNARGGAIADAGCKRRVLT